VPRLRADGPNQLWSWDITYLPTTVRGVWLYLYLVIDVWSRKVVAWDVAEVESAEIAAELVQRACLKERYCRPRGFGSRQSQQQPLILHADNGNAVAAGCDDPGNPRSSGLTLRRPTRLPVVVFRKICRPGLMGPISREASDLIRAWSRGPNRFAEAQGLHSPVRLPS